MQDIRVANMLNPSPAVDDNGQPLEDNGFSLSRSNFLMNMLQLRSFTQQVDRELQRDRLALELCILKAHFIEQELQEKLLLHQERVHDLAKDQNDYQDRRTAMDEDLQAVYLEALHYIEHEIGEGPEGIHEIGLGIEIELEDESENEHEEEYEEAEGEPQVVIRLNHPNGDNFAFSGYICGVACFVTGIALTFAVTKCIRR